MLATILSAHEARLDVVEGHGVQHRFRWARQASAPLAVSELGESPVLMVSLGSNNNKVVSTSEQGW